MFRAPHRLFAVLLAVLCAMTFVAPSVGVAQSKADIVKDLKKGSDFRVRVASALRLGQMRDPSTAVALEAALTDSHPAVRAAAAAALAKVGVPKSAVALRAAAATETNASVKKQMESAANKLAPSASSTSAKFIVEIGALKNRSGTNTPAADTAFKKTTEEEIRKVPGALVATSGSAVASQSSKKLPMVAIEGTLTKLQSGRSGSEVSYAAKVEYILKQMPQSALKGSISGSAEALASAGAVKTRSDHEQLQVDAVSAAVESAMKRAPTALSAAAQP